VPIPTLPANPTVTQLQEAIVAILKNITYLRAQLAILIAQESPAVAPSAAACSGVTFARVLQVGSSGSDVKCLQALLNQSADTQVSASGAGSPGKETTLFGSATKSAVVKFQEKYSSSILTPAGLTKGTGTVGASTRVKLNSLLGK
jgi:peptidoglycan hydrolase-like protein with peptidoglycan-binding domain